MTDEPILGSKLKHYMLKLQRKRRVQQLEDTLLAIVLNKDKTETIIEAIGKSNINRKTKEELTDWINCGELKDEIEE